MKRRGQLQDLILIPAIVFILAVTIIPLLLVVNNLKDSPGLGTTTQREIMNNQVYMLRGFDSMTVFIFVVLFLMVAGLAWMVRSSPIGIAVVIFLGLAIVLVGTLFSGMFTTISTDPNLIATSNSFPLTLGLFSKLPIFIMVGLFAVALLLFGKPQNL